MDRIDGQGSPGGDDDLDFDLTIDVGDDNDGVTFSDAPPPLEAPVLPPEKEKLPTYLDDDVDPVDDPSEDRRARHAEEDDSDDEDDGPGTPSGDPNADFERQIQAERVNMHRAQIASQAQSDIAVAQSQRDAMTMAMHTVDAQLKQVRSAVAAAREAADPYAEMQAQEQLEELRAARSQIQNNLGQIPSDDQIRQGAEQRIQQLMQSVPQSQDAGQIKPLTGLAGDWAKHNNWMGDPRFSSERNALIRFNDALVQENYDPNSPEFYNEITRRMARAFPNLRVKGLSGRTEGVKRSASSGMKVANPRGSGRRQGDGAPTNGKIQLTADDVRMMRTVGLDPKNKDELRAFAASKRDRLRAEGRA